MTNKEWLTSDYFTIEYKSHVLTKGDDGESNVEVTSIEKEVCFVYDSEGNLAKIGDGAYGSVYKGIMQPGITPNVAIKVLYSNSEVHPRHLKTLSPSERRQVLERLAQKYFKSPEPDGSNPGDGSQTAAQANDKKAKVLSKIKDDKGDFEQESIDEGIVSQLETIIEDNETSGDIMEALRTFYDGVKSKSSQSFGKFWDALEKGANSTSVYRFEVERDLNEQIRRLTLQKTEKPIGERNIVKVEGGCSTFLDVLDEDPDLAGKFKHESISASDYALVTKLYDYSLKDLLERRPVRNHQGKNGYEVLRGLSHSLRAREALFILEQAITGLKIIHLVKIFHRDIKPGNIFILELDLQGIAEIVLADLGNIPPNINQDPVPNQAETIEGEKPDRDYSPGTMNYRGPEQKYYRDVADVEVVSFNEDVTSEVIRNYLDNKSKAAANRQSTLPVGAVASNNHVTVLIAKDPKLANTLFSSNDIVLFSSDSAPRTAYTIRKVLEEKGPDNTTRGFGFVAFVLKEKVTKEDQPKTQVELYKTQAYRTDLFSMAAVLFEMLTIGHSAEHFYEGLRRFEGEPLSTILQRYDTLKGGRIDEANLDFAELFSAFYNENDPDSSYPDREIIEVLLKCMLYKSPGTYYDLAINNKEKDDPAAEASKLLETAINNLLTVYNDECYRVSGINSRRSILLHGETSIDNSGKTMFFNRRIEAMQGLVRWVESDSGEGIDIKSLDTHLLVANRLMFGAYDFLELTSFIRDKIAGGALSSPGQEGTGNNSTTLYQILPSFITYRGSDIRADSPFNIIAPAVELEESLQNRSALIISSAANAFVPNEIASMRRGIRLLSANENKHGGESIPQEVLKSDNDTTITLAYRFLDAAFVERRTQKGDMIVYGTYIWKISGFTETKAGEPAIKLEWVKDDALRSGALSFKSGQNEVDDSAQTDLDGNQEVAQGSPHFDVVVSDTAAQRAFSEIQTKLESDGYIDAIYYSEISPLKYYYEMLALYLQHLIFTYSPVTKTTRNRVDLSALLRMFGLNVDLAIVDSQTSTGNKLEEIYTEFVNIILRLTLHDAKGSFYKNALPEDGEPDGGIRELNRDMFSAVYSEAQRLYGRILKEVLGFSGPIVLSDYRKPLRTMEHLTDDLVGWIDGLAGDNRIDIETIVKESGQIAFPKSLLINKKSELSPPEQEGELL